VFEPFVRILGTQEVGSGLGLAIARNAAAALGGWITLADRLDGGSGLRVYLRSTGCMNYRLLFAAGAMAIAGCAHYEARPLPGAPDLLPDPRRVTVESTSMPAPSLRSHVFDPSDGLDMTEVAMLAVVNNPDLRLVRADAGIFRARRLSPQACCRIHSSACHANGRWVLPPMPASRSRPD